MNVSVTMRGVIIEFVKLVELSFELGERFLDRRLESEERNCLKFRGKRPLYLRDMKDVFVYENSIIFKHSAMFTLYGETLTMDAIDNFLVHFSVR